MSLMEINRREVLTAGTKAYWPNETGRRARVEVRSQLAHGGHEKGSAAPACGTRTRTLVRSRLQTMDGDEKSRKKS